MHLQRYLTVTEVAIRYGKSTRTITNWLNDPKMHFPRPFLLRGRSHFRVDGPDGLDAWDAAQATTTDKAAA